MNKTFHNFDFSNFWNDSDYALKAYVNPPPTDALIASVEEELGYFQCDNVVEINRTRCNNCSRLRSARAANATTAAPSNRPANQSRLGLSILPRAITAIMAVSRKAVPVRTELWRTNKKLWIDVICT